MNEVHADSFDYSEITELVNDGQSLTGYAVLIDAVGTPVKVAFTYVRGDDDVRSIPTADSTVSAIEWLHAYCDELVDDAEELLATRRDELRSADTMGKLIGWTIPRGRS